MNKILVKVYVQSIEEEFNVLIPINLRMMTVMDLMQKAINELSGGYYEVKEGSVLFDSIEGKVINMNNIVKYSGLRNGCSIMLC